MVEVFAGGDGRFFNETVSDRLLAFLVGCRGVFANQ